MFRRPRTARPNQLLTLALVALCGVLVQSALAASAPRDSANTARPNRSVESIRWQEAQYRSISELRAHVVRRGGNWERFLRTRPAIVRAYGLRPVRWDGRSFYSRSGLSAWLHARGKSYDAWARRHASARARLAGNAAAVLRRRGAVKSLVTPSGFHAVADTFVDSTRSNTSFGQAARLSVETPRTKHAYLRFDVDGLTSPVKKATLHLYSDAGTSSSIEVWEITAAWSETATWKSRPTLGRQLPGEISVAGGGTWASVDVTPFVAGNGRVDLALVARSGKRAASFASREAGPAAVLTIESATAAPLADAQAPTVPAGLAVNGATQTTIALSWSPSTDDVSVTGYGYYRDGTLVGSGAATSYTFSGLACGTSYDLAVAAYDGAGNRSARAGATAATSACGSVPPATSAKDAIGISSGGGLAWYNDADLARELDGYAAIGAKWLRFDLHWSVIEAGGKGVFNWSKHDRLVDAARARGLNLLGIVAYTPTWARNQLCATAGDKCEPARAEDYADFAAAAVRRYSSRGVKHFELWNEPNIKSFWLPAPNAQHYTALVRAAYPRMKAVDPGVTVMAGATSPAADNGTDIDPRTFLRAVYANGGGGNFDAWSHHPYYGPNRPADQYEWSAWHQMSGTSTSLRSLMVANGDSAKKIWATETGSLVGVTWSCCGTTTEERQATLLREALDLWRSYSWAGGLMYYNYSSHGGWSLTRADGSLRPAWYAYRDYR